MSKRAGIDARLLLLKAKPNKKNKKVVDAKLLLAKSKSSKGKKRKLKIFWGIDQKKPNLTPMHRRTIYGKFDDKCKFCRSMVGKHDFPFANCVNKKIEKFVPINHWLSDYGINCNNCRFKKIGEKKKIKWVLISDYYIAALKPYYDEMSAKEYFWKFHPQSIVADLITKEHITYCYAMLHNRPFARIMK